MRGRLAQRVGDPQLAFLAGVDDAGAKLLPVAVEALELVHLLAGDQDQVLEPGPHQRPDREVDHRLVEHVEEVLVHHLRHRMEPRAVAPRQDHALHASVPT